MIKSISLSVASLALAATSFFASTPASAERFGFGYGPRGGIGFSYESGGYCDSWGCPDAFWDYPIAYCPVYYDGDWYRGPFYYRYSHGIYYYWIHGDWRRDEWRDRRPDDACVDRFGPPLGYDFYISHGFIWRDEWRYRWFHGHHRHDHDHDGDHDGDHHRGNHGRWDHGGDHGRIWDHSGDHNGDHNGAAAGDQGGGAAEGATVNPTELGTHRHGENFAPRGGTGSPIPENSGTPTHDRGGETGGHHHDAPAASDSNGPRDAGGHHAESGGGGAQSPAAVTVAPSAGEPHHTSGDRGDHGSHHTKAP